MARYLAGNTPPFRHWNGVPIYLTTIITALFVVGLVATAIFQASRSGFIGWFAFALPLDPAWSVWRALTYVFINPVNFFTPFAILFFYWMSVGLETHLGRVVLAKLLLLLVLAVPAVAAIWYFALGVPFSTFGLGSYLFSSALLVAFATLYPNSEAWGWIPFKWVAFACIACGSLMLLAQHSWIELSQLWASCAAGFLYVRRAVEAEHDDHESIFARLGLWWRSRKFRVVRAEEARSSRRSAAREPSAADDVDHLLDKIAKSGIASLTDAERARLEKARQALMRKDGR